MEMRRLSVVRPCVWREKDISQRVRWVLPLHIQPSYKSWKYLQHIVTSTLFFLSDVGPAATDQPRAFWHSSHRQEDKPRRAAFIPGCVSFLFKVKQSQIFFINPVNSPAVHKALLINCYITDVTLGVRLVFIQDYKKTISSQSLETFQTAAKGLNEVCVFNLSAQEQKEEFSLIFREEYWLYLSFSLSGLMKKTSLRPVRMRRRTGGGWTMSCWGKFPALRTKMNQAAGSWLW